MKKIKVNDYEEIELLKSHCLQNLDLDNLTPDQERIISKRREAIAKKEKRKYETNSKYVDRLRENKNLSERELDKIAVSFNVAVLKLTEEYIEKGKKVSDKYDKYADKFISTIPPSDVTFMMDKESDSLFRYERSMFFNPDEFKFKLLDHVYHVWNHRRHNIKSSNYKFN